MLGLLLRLKARIAWNRTRLALREAPLRLLATVVLMFVVWFGLYGLFWLIFDSLRRTPLEATVAMPLVFNVFFAAILIMLTFSNAITAYSALFSRNETVYLLTHPIASLDFVSLKYLESLLLSSWSLILLGLPMMASLADHAEDPVFYFLLVFFFLAFIPIPGGLGLLLAWLVARFFPRNAARAAVAAGGILVAASIVWGLRSFQIGDSATEVWLRTFLARMSFVESAFFPNSWAAAGIDNALQGRYSESMLYLGVTLANALFLSWISVTIVSAHLPVAYDRASVGRARGRREAATASGGLAGVCFFYLPRPLRLIAAKDFRTFCRDPLQASQLLILMGLLVLYLTNMPTLRIHLGGTGWFLIMPFLNLCAICLILATFTCRFVYPLPSLEGRQLWLVGLLPVPLGTMLYAKYAFAMTVTLGVAVSAMGLAIHMLNLDFFWAIVYMVVTVAMCSGLCGFAVGMGARFPMMREPDVARIASGFGGTANLLASLFLVSIVLAAVGAAVWRSRNLPVGSVPYAESLALCLAAVLLAVFAGWTSMRIGASHFQRMEA